MVDDTREPRAVHPAGVLTEPVPLIETKSTRPSPASTEEGTVTEAVVPFPAPRPTARKATGVVAAAAGPEGSAAQNSAKSAVRAMNRIERRRWSLMVTSDVE